MPVNTGTKLDKRGVFKPGDEWTGNDKGRPKGSRNKLGEAFVADVYTKWEAHGVAVLDAMIEQDPSGFVRVVAGILPKEMIVKDPLHGISDEELLGFIHAMRELLAEQSTLAALEDSNHGA
jgi:hypothetical protein